VSDFLVFQVRPEPSDIVAPVPDVLAASTIITSLFLVVDRVMLALGPPPPELPVAEPSSPRLLIPPPDAVPIDVTTALTEPIFWIDGAVPGGTVYSIHRYPLKEVPMGEFELASVHGNGSWVDCPELRVAL
jgi:hypothetical protein